jgi:hypothetical protein
VRLKSSLATSKVVDKQKKMAKLDLGRTFLRNQTQVWHIFPPKNLSLCSNYLGKEMEEI